MKDYLSKMKTCCDLLGATGCRIEEEDQILYILGGLGREYDSVVVTVTSKAESSTVQDVSALLLSFESRIEADKNSSINLEGSQPTANVANSFEPKKEGGYQQRGNFHNSGRTQGNRGGYAFRGRGGRSSNNRLICQLCQKPGHSAERCWYRYEPSNGGGPISRQNQQSHLHQQSHFHPSNPTANLARAQGPQSFQSSPSLYLYFVSKCGFDVNSNASWYPDSRATHCCPCCCCFFAEILNLSCASLSVPRG
ncbi:uncharacterized protein LOC121755891 isoform X1 [Salvia splendens]|uniref:uncharacterized protein LOC121755891 isoform X1 n=1 Tax=Salvia splendens TaxID=180675 RepID=UPI001C258A92|nr:uncharacterized protein LOC121755891 isoform X1 [Salvia splendens]XP_042007256.1 uncharacterized protein LOC121755891 isoform X1 [Salvia splendens]